MILRNRGSRPTKPNKVAGTISPLTPGAEVRPEVAAGPASSPTSVAEAASSVSSVLVSRELLGGAVHRLDNLLSLFKRKNCRMGGGCGRLFLS